MAYAARPRIGVSNVVYAVLDETTDVSGGTPTYGTVYSLPYVRKTGFKSAASLATLYADDGPRFAAETIGDMAISLDLADISPDDEARLLGHARTNGKTVKTATDTSPYVAIGFKTLRSGKDSSNPVYSYFWFNKCIFQKPDVDAETKGASINYQTPTLEGRVVSLISSNQYMVTARSDDADVSATTISNWFNQPVIGSADLGALGVVIATATTNVSFTFTKTGGGSFSIPSAYISSAYMPVLDSTSVRAGTYSASGQGTATVTVTFTPTSAFGVAEIGAFASSAIHDSHGVPLTPSGIVLSF